MTQFKEDLLASARELNAASTDLLPGNLSSLLSHLHTTIVSLNHSLASIHCLANTCILILVFVSAIVA